DLEPLEVGGGVVDPAERGVVEALQLVHRARDAPVVAGALGWDRPGGERLQVGELAGQNVGHSALSSIRRERTSGRGPGGCSRTRGPSCGGGAAGPPGRSAGT